MNLENFSPSFVGGHSAPLFAAAGTDGSAPPAGSAAMPETGRAKASNGGGGRAPVAASETPRAGMLVGPPDRQFRLINDLSGQGQVWLARLVPLAPNAGAIEQPPEEFRVLRLFLPPTFGGSDVGAGVETNQTERMARVDAINWRSTLLKVRARVEAAVKLNHPHIARIYGWRQGAEGWPLVEMEHLDHRNGHSLAQFLRENGRTGFPFAKVIEWLRPVTSALDYARREHRIAHQHLNADTVFVTRDGVIKLLGFGMSVGMQEPRSVLFSGDTPTVEAVGPADSATPEAAFRQDVFALSLLIYQLLTGRSAYDLQTSGTYASMVPPPPGLTDAAWRVLRRGLAYPSELCPSDAGQFLSELEAAQGVAVTADYGRIPARKPWGWIIAAAVVVTVVVGLGLSRRQSGAESGTGQPVAAATTVPTPSAQDAAREADDRGFTSAQRVNTVEAYRLYLQGCPACGHEQAARTAIIGLENAEKVAQILADFDQAIQLLEQKKQGHQGDVCL